MGLLRILRRVVAFLLIAVVAVGVLSTFRYHPLIRRTIGPDGICGPFEEVFVYSPHKFSVAYDGEWYSYLAKDDEGYYVVAAGKEYGPFDEVIFLDTSSKGNSWGFVGQKGKTLYFIIDGVIRAELHDIGDIRTRTRPGEISYGRPLIWPRETPTLSADGKNWIFVVNCIDGKYAVLNGKKLGPYKQIYMVSVSPFGDAWGIIAAIDGAEYVMVNGNTYGPFTEAKELTLKEPRSNTDFAFSPDGTKWAAYGGPPAARRLLLNGEWFGPYEGVENSSWSENWDTWTLSGVGFRGSYFVVNGIEYGPYENVEGFGETPIWVNVAENGSSWGGRFVENGNRYVIINDVVYGPYDETWAPNFSPDGKKWGVTALLDEKVYLIVDGKVQRTSENNKNGILPSAPYFWDGHLIYRFLADGAWYVDFDGEVFGPFSDDASQYTILTAVGGDSWAYYLQEGKTRYLVVNGERYGPFPYVDSRTFLFNDSGTAWAYCVPDSGGRYIVYLNDEKYGPYYYVKTFASKNTVGFWALEELPDNMYRVVKKVVPE